MSGRTKGFSPCHRMTMRMTHAQGFLRTLDQDAQVGARKGRVGVVDDLQLAIRVEQKQRRLRERVVRLALAAGRTAASGLLKEVQREST